MQSDVAQKILDSIKGLDFDTVHEAISFIDDERERSEWTRKLYAIFQFVNQEFVRDLIAGNPEIDDLRGP